MERVLAGRAALANLLRGFDNAQGAAKTFITGTRMQVSAISLAKRVSCYVMQKMARGTKD